MARLGRSQPGYRSGHSFLRPPEVVDQPAPFIASPVRVQLADDTPNQVATERRKSLPGLGAPAVIEPPIQVIGGDLTQFAPQPQRQPAHSRLSPPAVLEVVVVPLAPEIRAALVAAQVRTQWDRHGAQYRLAPPTVVAPEPQSPFPGLRIKLVPPSEIYRRAQQFFSKLAAPAIVGAAEAPALFEPRVRTNFAHDERAQITSGRRKSLPGLGKPSIITPDFGVIGGVLLSYAESRNARSDGRRTPSSRLAPPATLGAPAPPPVEATLSVTLTEHHKPPAVRTQLSPPAPSVVTPFFARPVEVTKAQGRELLIRRRSHTRLRPPQVVTPLSDVIYIDYYDHPEPRGSMTSKPDAGGFDIPKPIGGVD